MPPKLIINGRMLGQPDVGIGVYTARLLHGLARHAKDTEITCVAPAGCEISFPYSTNIIFLPRFHAPKFLIDIAFDWVVDWTAQRKFPDHILLHPFPTPFASRPEKTCVVYHDCIPVHFPVYHEKKYLRRFISQNCDSVARSCSLVLTVSDFSHKDIIRYLGVSPERICKVHNWLPAEYNSDNAKRCANQVRTKYDLPSRFWLYVGGYDIRKNVEFLLEAYAIAKQKISCPPLVLAGRIPASGTYACCEVHKTITGLYLKAGYDIIMPGFISSEDMPGLYGAAELLIYPSLYEGFGLPAMEAMGCGCPAISSDNTSLTQVVRDKAYRFNTKSPEKLIKMLVRATSKALSMNPSFDQNEFSEKTALSLLLSHLRVGTHQV